MKQSNYVDGQEDDNGGLLSTLAPETLCQVIELLSPDTAARFSTVCAYARDLLGEGAFSLQLWRSHAYRFLGPVHASLLEAGFTPAQRGSSQVWRSLVRDGHQLDALRWWKDGSRRISENVDVPALDLQPLDVTRLGQLAGAAADDGTSPFQADALVKSTMWSYSAGTLALKSSLARAGHASVELPPLSDAQQQPGQQPGGWLLISGGMLRDCRATAAPLVLHAATCKVSRPAESGAPSTPRMHHTATRVPLQLGSALSDALVMPLGMSEERVCHGHAVLVVGGCDTEGRVMGGSQLEVMWLDAQCATLCWAAVQTRGRHPPPCFNHCAELFAGSSKLVVYGGTVQTPDGMRDAAPVAYVLELATLTWSSHETLAPAPLLCGCPPLVTPLPVPASRLQPAAGGSGPLSGSSTAVAQPASPFSASLAGASTSAASPYAGAASAAAALLSLAPVSSAGPASGYSQAGPGSGSSSAGFALGAAATIRTGGYASAPSTSSIVAPPRASGTMPTLNLASTPGPGQVSSRPLMFNGPIGPLGPVGRVGHALAAAGSNAGPSTLQPYVFSPPVSGTAVPGQPLAINEASGWPTSTSSSFTQPPATGDAVAASTAAPPLHAMPLQRTLATSAIRADEATGAEELVLVGGRAQGKAQPMVPMALDLATFQWRIPARYCCCACGASCTTGSVCGGSEVDGSWCEEEAGQGDLADSCMDADSCCDDVDDEEEEEEEQDAAAGTGEQQAEDDGAGPSCSYPSPAAGAGAVPPSTRRSRFGAPYLPTPRLRSGSWCVGGLWLVLLGGHDHRAGSRFYDDTQRLHLPSLTWYPPPRMIGQPPWLTARAAGLSATAGVAFGGCISSVMGLMPVVRTDFVTPAPAPTTSNSGAGDGGAASGSRAGVARSTLQLSPGAPAQGCAFSPLSYGSAGAGAAAYRSGAASIKAPVYGDAGQEASSLILTPRRATDAAAASAGSSAAAGASAVQEHAYDAASAAPAGADSSARSHAADPSCALSQVPSTSTGAAPAVLPQQAQAAPRCSGEGKPAPLSTEAVPQPPIAGPAFPAGSWGSMLVAALPALVAALLAFIAYDTDVPVMMCAIPSLLLAVLLVRLLRGQAL
mmetsp:Transcript_418/g.1091  ORF Transcript_418/g.1091 Transcript_418/m.1091 type:complete len:1105 (-) Transcript_418:1621-4935(-)